MANNNESVSNMNVNTPNHEDLPKGRPKKGRKRKFLNQTKADKKTRLNSNQIRQ